MGEVPFQKILGLMCVGAYSSSLDRKARGVTWVAGRRWGCIPASQFPPELLRTNRLLRERAFAAGAEYQAGASSSATSRTTLSNVRIQR